MSATSIALPREQNGFGEYIQRIREFSTNAKLYIVHIVGMDVIYGTWQVLFNLYLLAVFANGVSFELFGNAIQMSAVQLIGARIAINGLAGAFGAIPAGMISDRIGRKYSFILGDYAGAVLSLGNITTLNPIVLLITPIFESLFGTLHQVSEPAFMAENSEPAERVHLFSFASSMRTLAALSGALLGGFASTIFIGGQVAAYRSAAIIGVAGWTLSLVPALLLTQKSWDVPKKEKGKQGLFSKIQHPDRIARMVVINVVVGLAVAFVVPLFNVYFRQGIHAHDSEIGVTFAGGSLLLALTALFGPTLASRFGKVPAIVSARLLGIPFVLLLAFAPDVEKLSQLSLLSIAGAAYIARNVFRNVSGPIASAFEMEILAPQERGTAVGAGAAMFNLTFAIGGFAGAAMMSAGDYRTPFVLMAIFYLAGDVLYWFFFRKMQAVPEK
ncbi:MAG: MFS transporter [Chloroflexi bacterium]|nr:MFS transporter [Chloroflexota bacterium]